MIWRKIRIVLWATGASALLTGSTLALVEYRAAERAERIQSDLLDIALRILEVPSEVEQGKAILRDRGNANWTLLASAFQDVVRYDATPQQLNEWAAATALMVERQPELRDQFGAYADNADLVRSLAPLRMLALVIGASLIAPVLLNIIVIKGTRIVRTYLQYVRRESRSRHVE